MIPTERGKELYTQVAQALDTLERTSQTLRATTAERPLLRVGAPAEYFGEVILRLLQGVPIRLTVRFEMPQTLIPALEQGELDIVIATQRQPAMSVDYHKLAEEQFLLVGGVQQPLAPIGYGERPEQTIQNWLLEQPWISYGAELPIIRRFWQSSFNTRPAIQPVLIIPDLRIIAQAVEYGYGISVLPEYVCRTALLEDCMRIVWQPPHPMNNELWLGIRRVDRNKPELQQLCQALQGGSLS
jgi:DNA-binding transcriptional LysR family regulator